MDRALEMQDELARHQQEGSRPAESNSPNLEGSQPGRVQSALAGAVSAVSAAFGSAISAPARRLSAPRGSQTSASAEMVVRNSLQLSAVDEDFADDPEAQDGHESDTDDEGSPVL